MILKFSPKSKRAYVVSSLSRRLGQVVKRSGKWVFQPSGVTLKGTDLAVIESFMRKLAA